MIRRRERMKDFVKEAVKKGYKVSFEEGIWSICRCVTCGLGIGVSAMPEDVRNQLGPPKCCPKCKGSEYKWEPYSFSDGETPLKSDEDLIRFIKGAEETNP